MEDNNDLLLGKIRLQSNFAKIDALVSALDEHQKTAYQEALRCKKEEFISRHHSKLDAELLQLVGRLYQ